MKSTKSDVIVVGAGHNGLVAALLLARKGLTVTVVEEKAEVGGAVKTERPFKNAPNLGTSTGAYLLGLMPPELLTALNVDLPLVRRDPHYFLPTLDGRYLIFGSDEDELKRQFITFFSEADYRADRAMQAEIAMLREDVAPTWLTSPLTIEGTAEKYVRPALRQIFIDLCRKPISHYLGRFEFKSDLLRAMYAVTDAFSGLHGTWDTPGTGMNFLIHNMCRLPRSGGTWMIVEGGMGTITQRFAAAARAAGCDILTSTGVDRIVSQGGQVKGVLLKDGRELSADTVVCNADPFRMQQLVGDAALPEKYRARIANYVRPGSTFKVNMALKGLPRFKCLPDALERKAFGPTIHLLPDENEVLQRIKEGHAAVMDGRLYDFPTIEWYIHTTVDPSLRDKEGNHNSALFVQWVPYTLKGTTWEKEEAGYVKKLLAICDRFAPGTSELVVDTFPLHPAKIEQHFGITHGHIHHVDNSFGFSDRLPYETPVAGLYSCSAGCHPAGSVIGAAGHNAAQRVLSDLGRGA